MTSSWVELGNIVIRVAPTCCSGLTGLPASLSPHKPGRSTLPADFRRFVCPLQCTFSANLPEMPLPSSCITRCLPPAHPRHLTSLLIAVNPTMSMNSTVTCPAKKGQRGSSGSLVSGANSSSTTATEANV